MVEIKLCDIMWGFRSVFFCFLISFFLLRHVFCVELLKKLNVQNGVIIKI